MPSMRKQATLLTLANGATRAVGFVMHLLLARLMGAEALGMMEMAHSVEMLALTPVTAGLPSAMSRIVARPETDRRHVLHAGVRLVSRMAWRIMPALALSAPLIAWLMGDLRTLPAILVSVPDVLLLGLCAVYSGYCYGVGNARLPAFSEFGEQGIRFVLSLTLLITFRRVHVQYLAALPGLAETVAAFAMMFVVRRRLPLRTPVPPAPAMERELTRLSSPMIASRLCATGVRAFSAVLLPVCLRRSGLSAAAATAQYGLLTGMAMPLMMLPGMVTGAVAMVATPTVAAMEQDAQGLRRLSRQLLLTGLGLGAASCGVIWLTADFVANTLYRTPALSPLVKLMSPLTVMLAVHQVQFGLIAGLGLQRKALTGTLLSAIVQLAITALLAPVPRLRLFGAVIALTCSEAVALTWSLCLVRRHRDGRSA
ncbi:MAG: oligosaccharide flippase family protein [Clostridia bacterium]|nr:oligosaccharide flippase family protein [Clostridia bacterium]